MLLNINHNILTELKYERAENILIEPWPPPTLANIISLNRTSVNGFLHGFLVSAQTPF